MNIVCLPVEKTVHRTWLRKPVARDTFDLFRTGLKRLFDRIDQGESEEHLKRIVADFLTEVWYRDVGEINTKERADLVIHAGRSSRDPVAVIIETKHPANAAEMIAAAVLHPQCLHRPPRRQLQLFGRFPEEDAHVTDAEIDALVCDLYGLTAEEIRILEKSGKTTDE